MEIYIAIIKRFTDFKIVYLRLFLIKLMSIAFI